MAKRHYRLMEISQTWLTKLLCLPEGFDIDGIQSWGSDRRSGITVRIACPETPEYEVEEYATIPTVMGHIRKDEHCVWGTPEWPDLVQKSPGG